MLIEFKVANFRSFHEEQTFSMVADSKRDKSHPENLIPCGDFNLLKTAAIYGANASGKSNLIKAMGTMQWLVRNSATSLKPDELIPRIDPFRLDPDSKKMPSRFAVIVLIDGIQHNYAFSVTPQRVCEEQLTVDGDLWFHRRVSDDGKEMSWKFAGPLKAIEILLKERTRDNCLVLSRGADLNVKELWPLYIWFLRFWVWDLSESQTAMLQWSAEKLREKPDYQEKVLALLRQADLGIGRLDYEAVPEASEKSILAGLLTDQKDKTPRVKVRTLHQAMGQNEGELFDLEEDESNGTKRFFTLLYPLIEFMFEDSWLMAIDELDCSLHPMLTRKLIELVHSPQWNKKGGQLVFATHDTTLMDPSLLRRDQIWLVDKNEKGASELFSLHDFKNRPRISEAFARNYLAGRYGAVPRFGPLLENLDSPADEEKQP
jgi:uncharacterized protein